MATVDIPGALMQPDMECEDTFMKLEGKTVSILNKLDPKLYSNHVVQENGKDVLYVKLKKRYMVRYRYCYFFGKN